MSTFCTELTDEEAELYDRQIRLWGIAAQKRLRSAKVLIIGLQGLGCEVSKNVILAGIKSITLLDHKVLDIKDGCSQFLAPVEKIGMNRAEASVERCQQLNPMVHVVADKSNISDKPNSFFGEFDIVFASNCSVDQLIHIDRVCRQQNVPFYCGDVFGLFGYIFCDLNFHKYTMETLDFVNGEPKRVTTQKTTSFISLEEALSVDWKSESNSHRAKEMDPSFFLMTVLQRFREEQGHDPYPANREKDMKMLEDLCQKELAKLNMPIDKIPQNLISHTILEISPTCGVLGGILGCEIIKALSQRDAPMNNFFFFNPVTCTGFMESIG